MANYDNPVSRAEVVASVTSRVDSTVAEVLNAALPGTAAVVAKPISGQSGLSGVSAGTQLLSIQVPDTGSQNLDLRNLDALAVASLKALVFENDAPVAVSLPTRFSGVVVLGDGANRVASSGSGAVAVQTGTGADTVALGSGKDTVVVAGGNDSIRTGSGDDTVTVQKGFTGKATIDGGSGNDTVDLSANATKSVKNGVITLADGSTVKVSNVNSLVIATSTGADTVALGSTQDTVTLAGGSDSIATGGGSDTIKFSAGFGSGAAATATIDGGAGRDSVDLTGLDIASVVQGVGANRGFTVISLEDGTKLLVKSVEVFIYEDPVSKTVVTTVGTKDILGDFPV